MSESEVQKLKDGLNLLTTFLDHYSPLANAHANDFFTHQLWSLMVSPNIRAELTSPPFYPEPMYLITYYLQIKAKLIENAKYREDVLTRLKSRFASTQTPPPLLFDLTSGYQYKGVSPNWIHEHSLSEFIESCALLSLDVLWFACENTPLASSTSSPDLKVITRSINPQGTSPLVSHGMNEKKAHEVALMGPLCSTLSTAYGCPHVVDVGSGKGYLGAYLSLLHGLTVTEIDSCDSHVQRATVHREQLQTRWAQLLKKAHINDKTLLNLHVKSPSTASCTSITALINSVEDLETVLKDFVTKPPSEEEQKLEEPFLMIGLHACGGLSASMIQAFTSATVPGGSVLVNVACCYHLLREARLIFNSTMSRRGPDGEFVYSYSEECDKNQSKLPEWNAHSTAQLDFPLSNHLKSRVRTYTHISKENMEAPFRLGRNARIIAAQSLERVAAPDSLTPHESMFHRVVLQQVLLDRLGFTRDDWVVGRLGKKVTVWRDFARAGLRKLQFHAEETAMSDSELDGYMDRFAESRFSLFAFFLLRCCLGPVVEAMVLLDRLLALHESRDKIADAVLVQLFDSKTSPRSYALVAVKSKKTQPLAYK